MTSIINAHSKETHCTLQTPSDDEVTLHDPRTALKWTVQYTCFLNYIDFSFSSSDRNSNSYCQPPSTGTNNYGSLIPTTCLSL